MSDHKKTMLICGATGFIGKNLVEYYATKGTYNLKAVHHIKPPYDTTKFGTVEWVEADLNNPKDVQRVVKGVDIVLQFAATTSGAGDIVSRPHIHVTDNAVMNSLLLRECYESNVEHFVFPSCTVMYQPSDNAIAESDFDGNKELLAKYFGVGNTKVYIEKMCKFYARLGTTKHTVLRHSNIYGPHDKYDLKRSHVFGASITKVMTTDPPNNFVMWGSGSEKRDLLHVDDLVSFIDLALEKQQSSYELFNVGYGDAIAINALVETIIAAAKKNLHIEHDLTKPTIKTNVFLDCTKAKNLLGWEPQISLKEGIKTTLEWYKENIMRGTDE